MTNTNTIQTIIHDCYAEQGSEGQVIITCMRSRLGRTRFDFRTATPEKLIADINAQSCSIVVKVVGYPTDPQLHEVVRISWDTRTRNPLRSAAYRKAEHYSFN